MVAATVNGMGSSTITRGTPGASARRVAATLGASDAGRWRAGAAGEERTAATIAALERRPLRRCVALHDRAVPQRTLNIDHLVVAASGVWVCDTKVWAGHLEVRDEVRVAGRSTTAALRALDPQVVAAAGALTAAGHGEVPVTAAVVLDGRRFATRYETSGVVCSPDGLRRELRRRGPLSRRDRVAVAALLADAFEAYV